MALVLCCSTLVLIGECVFVVFGLVFHTKPRDWLGERPQNDPVCVEWHVKTLISQLMQLLINYLCQGVIVFSSEYADLSAGLLQKVHRIFREIFGVLRLGQVTTSVEKSVKVKKLELCEGKFKELTV